MKHSLELVLQLGHQIIMRFDCNNGVSDEWTDLAQKLMMCSNRRQIDGWIDR